jgi:hypothetical protein
MSRMVLSRACWAKAVGEQTNVAGDKIDVHGSGNTIVNRSTVTHAFNRVKATHTDEVAEMLLEIEAAINKSGNKEAAEFVQ